MLIFKLVFSLVSRSSAVFNARIAEDKKMRRLSALLILIFTRFEFD